MFVLPGYNGELIVWVNKVGSVNTIVVSIKHPLMSVIVTVYVPAVKFDWFCAPAVKPDPPTVVQTYV
jgi:hypothetical protein